MTREAVIQKVDLGIVALMTALGMQTLELDGPA